MGADASAYKTEDGGNILHFAVECASHFKGTWEATKDTSQCLRELLKKTKLLIDQPDDNGTVCLGELLLIHRLLATWMPRCPWQGNLIKATGLVNLGSLPRNY